MHSLCESAENTIPSWISSHGWYPLIEFLFHFFFNSFFNCFSWTSTLPVSVLMDNVISGYQCFHTKNIHSNNSSKSTEVTLGEQKILPTEYILYGYDDSELNGVQHPPLPLFVFGSSMEKMASPRSSLTRKRDPCSSTDPITWQWSSLASSWWSIAWLSSHGLAETESQGQYLLLSSRMANHSISDGELSKMKYNKD